MRQALPRIDGHEDGANRSVDCVAAMAQAQWFPAIKSNHMEIQKRALSKRAEVTTGFSTELADRFYSDASLARHTQKEVQDQTKPGQGCILDAVHRVAQKFISALDDSVAAVGSDGIFRQQQTAAAETLGRKLKRQRTEADGSW